MKRQDKHLENGSIIHWSQEKCGSVPVTCGMCRETRLLTKNGAGDIVYGASSGLCRDCSQGVRGEEDIRLDNGSIIHWTERKERRVPVTCGVCGKTRQVARNSAVEITNGHVSGLCVSCSRSRCMMLLEDTETDNGSIVYWSRRNRDQVPVQCGKCGQIRWLTATAAGCIKNGQSSGLCSRCLRGSPGGRKITPAGYVQVRIYPDSPFYSMADTRSYVLEHRLIMAEHLERVLKEDEIVHHKNGIKDDNHIENLELLTRDTHHPGHHPSKISILGRIADLARHIAKRKL